MPYKDVEMKLAYRKSYYSKNRAENIAKTAEWRKNHKEQRNKTARIRNAILFREDPEFREYRRKKTRESYWLHHDKRLALAANHRHTPKEYARRQARNAIRRGEILKPTTCQRCGITSRLQMHHPDYSQPLNITFLCALCHGALRVSQSGAN